MIAEVPVEDVRRALNEKGYYVSRISTVGKDPVQMLVGAARSLGELFVPGGCDPVAPVIRTAPSQGEGAAPFDRPERIGWHGDFSTHESRPEISLVFVTRPDPRGGDFGAWRLASVDRVLSNLQSTERGRDAYDFLIRDKLPFSYADGESPRWFNVIEQRTDGRVGLRFYVPSVRRGCVTAYGAMPRHISASLVTLERAADGAGEIVPTHEGSLMIASNWFALHDRVEQTVDRSRPNREALLCFVSIAHPSPSRNQE